MWWVGWQVVLDALFIANIYHDIIKMPGHESSPAGTGMPHCSIYCNNPTVFRQTDFPPAFGPDISRIRCPGRSSTSSGTTFPPCLANECCSNGCMARIQLMLGFGCMFGTIAPKLLLNAFNARKNQHEPESAVNLWVQGCVDVSQWLFPAICE